MVNVNLSSLLGAPASATVAGSPYPITVSNAAGSGLGNYTIHYNSGLLSVVAVASPLPNTNDLSQFIQDATAIDQTNALAINLQSADSTSRSKSKESLDELRSAASAIIAGRLGEPYYLITIPNPPVISPGEAQYVLPYATLARDSNLDSSATGGLYGFAQVLGNDGKPEDWFTIMAMNGVSDSDIKQYKEAGFFARIYRNNLGEVVIAFRESVDHDSDHSTERWKNDWDKTNFPEVAGQTTAQYLAAAALTLAVKTVLKPNVLTVTGFSKGGGQASYSGKYANRIVTFDAARNHDADNGLNNARNEHQINVIVPGDKVGDPRSLVTYGVGQLPGLYASAQSSNSNTHSIDGIIGWLQGIARP